MNADSPDASTSVGQATASPLGEAPRIDDLSLTSLYLKLYSHAGEEKPIGTATGFVVEHFGRNYLVTNWHVFEGRHPETRQPLHRMGALPDEVRIACLTTVTPEKLAWNFIPPLPLLNADGSRRWVEHPLGEKVDVAALELGSTPLNIMPWRPLDLSLADEDLELYPSMPVSIIGFPAGLRANAFIAIWKTGHIASDPDILYNGLPAFLIDATTRNDPQLDRGRSSRRQGYDAERLHDVVLSPHKVPRHLCEQTSTRRRDRVRMAHQRYTRSSQQCRNERRRGLGRQRGGRRHGAYFVVLARSISSKSEPDVQPHPKR